MLVLAARERRLRSVLEAMPQSVGPGSYRLTRNFALGALVVVALAATGFAAVYRSLAVAQLQRMADQNNAALTQTFANGVWPRFRDFIESAHGLAAEDIRAHPRTAALTATVAEIMAGTRVLKVKLYDLRGLTVFSTAPEQIGADYGDNPRFLGALAGRSVAELEHRERFGAIDGPRESLWVLSSYIPVRPAGAEREIEGVAEIYSDVTDIQAYIRHNELTLIAVVGLGFLLVFLLLLGIVAFAERQIRRYHRRSLELAASCARAEAASRAKSTFLANMGHELRTPLNAIIGFSELIRDAAYGPLGSGRYREAAADIHASGRHLLEIINDVLDLVQAEAGTMAVARGGFDAAELVREVARLLAEQAEAAGIELATRIPQGPVRIESDEAKVRQILLNLAGNAIDFTPAGGAVSIALRFEREPGGIELVVSDSGIGIAPEDIPKALAPFSQIDDGLARKRDGTGLGLPLSRTFAELLGGSLEIDSRPGGGTRVSVVLPDRAAAGASGKVRSAA